MKAQVFTTITSALARIRRDLVPRIAGDAQHHLAVNEVLRAAERDETNLHSQVQFYPRSARSSGEAPSNCASAREFLSCAVGSCHGYILYSIRGYGIASRRCSRPQIQVTTRSMPMPKPPWGTLP